MQCSLNCVLREWCLEKGVEDNQNRGGGITILWLPNKEWQTLNKFAQDHNEWQEISHVSLQSATARKSD